MNLYLHGIGPEAIAENEDPPIIVGDALQDLPEKKFDYVLTNPPFGKKSSFTVINEKGEAETKKLVYEREDFWATSSNKQLNFLQHVANVLFFDRKPASETPWTQKLWIYDLRTNKHFTLKRNPLGYDDLKDFLSAYGSGSRSDRGETERFKAFDYEELTSRDKTNLDIFWLKDDSLEDTENLPEPDVLAAEIVENLGSALEQFSGIQEELQAN